MASRGSARWAGPALTAASVVLTLLAAEVLLRIFEESTTLEPAKSIPDAFVPDPALGYRLQPGRRIHARLDVLGERIYEVDYTIDAHGRRVHPVRRPPVETTAIGLFFGGSYTFGSGVEDGETLPARVEALTPSLRAINYGVPGWGPTQALELLQSKSVREGVPSAPRFGVFTFIDNHVDRVIGSFGVCSRWAADFPYYRLERGELVRVGTFSSARPLRAALYALLGSSHLVSEFTPVWPPRADEHYRITARVLVEARNAFAERFGSAPFHVLIYPGTRAAERMVPLLESAGISVLDYSHLFEPAGAWRLSPDPHPTPRAYQVLAAELVEDLRRLGIRLRPTDLASRGAS